MAERLTDGLWHIDCRTRDKPNVYVVDDGDRTLVDAGWPGDEASVRNGLVEAGFLADFVYARGERLQPTGRVTSYDSEQVEASIRELLAEVSAFEHACPGHGPPLTDGAAQLSRVLDS